ncbi:MAG: nucleotidyltransferase substrate binding protein [Verrucomicrobiaceae bacterium]|nr:nucleotidyltransferase substrate binding protein [Verrucomicrobiaceae bacterium]
MPAQPSKLQVILSQFDKACDRLSDVLAMPADEFNLVRDSAIQRFEFTYELFWKVIRTWAAKKKDVVHSPSECFDYAFKRKLISNQENVFAAELIKWRNLTSHMYEESMAQEIYERLPKAAAMMRSTIQRLKEKDKKP